MSSDHPDLQRRERRAPAPGLALVIGAGAAHRVEIAVLGYTHPASDEPFDAAWLSAEVEVAAGVFAGRFPATFRIDDFVLFRDALATLQKSLVGETTFETMERQLALRLLGNGHGQIALTGTARHPIDGNVLSFAFDLDQTQLVAPLSQLERLIARFPVRA